VTRHLVLGIAALAWASSAAAFGPEGHQTVGKLADSLIAGTHAAARVRQIIGMSLEQASVWADCAKGVNKTGSGKFVYQASGQFPECKPFETSKGKRAMAAFVGRNWDGCHPAADEEACHKQYHYADVALQHDHYERGFVGTSDHDVVAAINAAVETLRGGSAPPPFRLASKREALLLLTHCLGDIHQPLHVEAVYLDAQGHVVDPDEGAFDPDTKTIGGYSLTDAGANLHHEWDTVPAPLKPDQLGVSGVAEAKAVAPTPGDVTTWSAQWATDTIHGAAPVFAGTTFSPESASKHWQVTVPASYANDREALQRTQLIKAGARLAELLQALWP
jgi:hypothetical protein